MREQLSLNSVAGLPTFSGRPFLTEPEQLDEWQPDVAIVGAPFDIADDQPAGSPVRSARDPRRPTTRPRITSTSGWRSSTGSRSSTSATRTARTARPRSRTPTSASASTRWRRAASCRSSSAATTRSPGRPRPRSPTSTATATSASSTSTRTPTPPTSSRATSPATAPRCAGSSSPARCRARHFVQVGLRGYWPPPEVFEWMLEQGMRWHLMQEIWERGFKAVMRDAVSEALARADKLYVSVDIDVLDPGIRARHRHTRAGRDDQRRPPARRASALPRANVVALDVVEVSPPYDWAERRSTTRTASCSNSSPDLHRNVVALFSDGRGRQGGGPKGERCDSGWLL